MLLTVLHSWEDGNEWSLSLNYATRGREMGSVCDCISCYSETMFVLLVYGDRVDEGLFPIGIAIDNGKDRI